MADQRDVQQNFAVRLQDLAQDFLDLRNDAMAMIEEWEDRGFAADGASPVTSDALQKDANGAPTALKHIEGADVIGAVATLQAFVSFLDSKDTGHRATLRKIQP